MVPCVVSAVKSGASSPSCNAIMSDPPVEIVLADPRGRAHSYVAARPDSAMGA